MAIDRPGMKFERIGPDHKDGLVCFFNDLKDAGDERFFHPHPLTPVQAEWVSQYRGKDRYYVLTSCNRVLGYGMLRGWDDGFEIPSLGIAIHPQARGQGLGRAMMMFLHEEARRHGATHVRLTVDADNTSALKLYRELGYSFTVCDSCEGRLVGLLQLPMRASEVTLMQPDPCIYVSTACLPHPEDLGTRVRAYVSAGLGSVELGAYVTVREPDAHVEEEVRAARALLVHNYFPPPPSPFVLNLASADPVTAQQSLDLATNALRLCSRLGVPFYSVHAGFVIDPVLDTRGRLVFPDHGRQGTSEAFDRFLARIRTLVAIAEELNVDLLVENNVCTRDLRGKLLLQGTDEFLALFESVASPRLGLLLDTGHLNVSSTTLGKDRLEFVDRLMPRIRAFHVHDNDGLVDAHEPLTEGSWVLEVLKHKPLTGLPVIVEAKFPSIASIRSHVDWLARETGRSW